MKKKTIAQLAAEQKAKEVAEAKYWVRVMARLHRMQSRAMSRDPWIQERMSPLAKEFV